MKSMHHLKKIPSIVGLILTLCLLSPSAAFALDVTLSWKKNPITDDVTKYQIYYSTSPFTNSTKNEANVSSFEVELTDEYATPSEFPDMNPSTDFIYKLTGLDNLNVGQIYYFGVTAVNSPDGDEIESPLSSIVNTIENNPDDPDPDPDDGDSDDDGNSSGDSNNGGGSGGCFIKQIYEK